jgi:HD-GYP domain-containing protein (c-di-GMP phosphodiesterase class II)
MTADRWPLVLFVGDTVRARLVRAALPAVVGSIALFALLDVIRNRTGGMQNPALASAVFIGAVVTISTAVIHAASGIGRKVDADALVMRETLRDLASSNARMKHMVNDVITAMARVVEVRDPYTQGHERRVAMLATELAVQMELCDDECEGIKLAALVHDVGKLALPAEILNKPGRLSDIEFALIRGHAQAGHDILSDIDFGWPIAQIVLQHHERLDGTGYPNGLLGDEVLMEARIIAVADVVEAMASHRPYRPALGLDTAVKEISDYPEKFDADVTSALLALYADGSLQRMLPDRALIA